MRAIIGAFVTAWLGYFGLIALLPIEYLSVEFSAAVAVLAVYVFATIACALAVGTFDRIEPTVSGVSDASVAVVPPLDRRELGRIVVLGLLLSVAGAALLAYVRVVVQGIDFTHGLAVARELWRAEGEERSHISSPLSVPGYGFGFFFYASTFLGHLHWEHLSRGVRRVLVAVSFLLIACHSVLTGGRMVLLLQLISVVAAATVRRAQGRAVFPGRFWRIFFFGAVCVLGALGYSLYVFSERASASGIDAEAYAQTMITYMGASPTEAFLTISSWPEPFASVTQFAVIAGAYVTHSAGTVASVMEYSSKYGEATFLSIQELLARLGLLPPVNTDWVLAGAFLSLPGAIWYDYGLGGVLVGAIVSGVGLAAVWRWVRRTRGGGISVGLSAAVLITTVMSPLIMAPDSLAFPFMLLGYLGLAGYSYVAFGPRNWWRVGRRCRVSGMPGSLSRRAADESGS